MLFSTQYVRLISMNKKDKFLQKEKEQKRGINSTLPPTELQKNLSKIRAIDKLI